MAYKTRKRSHVHLNVYSPMQVRDVDYIGAWMGESRSTAAREIIRRGIESYLREAGFRDMNDLINALLTRQQESA